MTDDTTKYISIKTCTVSYQIEPDFLHSLNDLGLIQIEQQANEDVIEDDQLGLLEKFIRLHYDMHVNMEGLEAIHELLTQINDYEYKVQKLKAELSIYR